MNQHDQLKDFIEEKYLKAKTKKEEREIDSLLKEFLKSEHSARYAKLEYGKKITRKVDKLNFIHEKDLVFGIVVEKGTVGIGNTESLERFLDPSKRNKRINALEIEMTQEGYQPLKNEEVYQLWLQIEFEDYEGDYGSTLADYLDPVVVIGENLELKHLGHKVEWYSESSFGVGGYYFVWDLLESQKLIEEFIEASNLKIKTALLLNKFEGDNEEVLFPKGYKGNTFLF